MLDEIIKAKHEEVRRVQQAMPLEAIKTRVRPYRAEHSLAEALSREPISLIAELKQRSPSKGLLRDDFDPVALALELQEAGADALSVLTDQHYFGGALTYLREVRTTTEIPCLRKDFIVDEYQVYESALYSADVILLIVRILTDEQLGTYIKIAGELGMDCLVEIHEEPELERALNAGAKIIGINHRNLQTFHVDTTLSDRLVKQIPDDKLVVAESGIHTADDVLHMQDLGVHGLLIGESIMTSPDVGAKVASLFDEAWSRI